MKFTKIAAAMLLAAGMFANVACNDAKRTENETTETTAAAKITDKAYICPMKCEGSASDSVGKCPVCAMDLEKNPDYAPVAPADATETATPADPAAEKK
jgi:hypothetical protein